MRSFVAILSKAEGAPNDMVWFTTCVTVEASDVAATATKSSSETRASQYVRVQQASMVYRPDKCEDQFL